MGTSRSRRLQVGFTPAQRSAIAERARGAGLSLSATVRQLVAASLTLEATTGASNPPAALAALGAAGHAVLMCASALPKGQRRRHGLAPGVPPAAQDWLLDSIG